MHFTRRFVQHIATLSILAILSAFVAPGAALAKAPNASKSLGWDNVLELRKGTAVRVVLFSRKMFVGKVDRVEPAGIAVTTKQESLLLAREDIKSIWTLAKPKVANPGLWAMVGGALLAGVGGLAKSAHQISQLNNGKLPSGNGHTLEIAGLGVAVGGMAALVLVGKPTVIYEAVQPPADAGK